MAQLRQDYFEFVRRRAEVVVIGPEDADSFAHHWKQNQYLFVGLPDPEHRVADLYGQQVNLFKLGRMPALMIIDIQGRVRHQHYGNSMGDIPPNKGILIILDQLNQEYPIEESNL